jgi:hypothetical protein
MYSDHESGESPDVFYVTLNVEARKNGLMLVKGCRGVKKHLPLRLAGEPGGCSDTDTESA